VTSLIPPQFEYLILDIFLATLLFALFGEELTHLLFDRAFWVGLSLFFLFCAVLETIALASGWWLFTSNKVLGVFVLNIPIEEYVMFVNFYVFVVCTWECAGDDMD